MSTLDHVQNERFSFLTTTGRRTGKPHTVELWFAIGGGKMYLSHEGDATDWMKNIVKDNKVKVKVGSVDFDLKARTTEKGSETRELGERVLYEKYYGSATKNVINDWFELSTVIELTPP